MANSCWNGWLRAAARFNKVVEDFFHKYGYAISGYPIVVMVICVLFTGAFGWGLAWLKVESRTEKLYVPQNSRSELDLKNGDKFFPIQTRIAKIVMVRSDKGNVLTSETFKTGFEVMKSIINHTNIQQVCIKSNQRGGPFIQQSTSTCARADPFQIFNYSIQAMNASNIAHTINAIEKSPEYLLLNGRPLAAEIGNIFGKIKRDQFGNVSSAEALRIIFPITFPNTDAGYSDILKWEGIFLDHVKSLTNRFKQRGLDLYFFTFKSIDDSIDQSTSGDIKFISITFTIMCTFSCLALSRFRSFVTGHGLAGMVGILVVGMGILSGFGLVIICGTKFTSTVGVLPFLILGVAIDDMFIILDELDRANFNLPTRQIIANVLGKVGGSVTMTTLTDLVAFAVSTTSAFPAIQYFCTFAAVGLILSYLMIMTFFVSFLVFDINRIKAGRFDMVPFFKKKDFEINKITGIIVEPTTSIATKIMGALGNFISNTYGSLIVILFSIGLVTAGIIGTLNISQKFTLQMLGKDGSDYIKFLDIEGAYYPDIVAISIVVPGGFKLDNAANQEEYLKLDQLAIKDNNLMLSNSINWLKEFKAWSTTNGSSITGANFIPSLHTFLRIPKNAHYHTDIRFKNSMTELQASRVVVFMRNTEDTNAGKNSMLKLRESIDKNSRIKLYIAAVPFLYFEQYVLLVPETTRNVIVCAVTVLIMTSPFLLHPGILILMVFSFSALIVELMGLMTIWNVSLNSISMIVITMAIGFCVDYSAHVAHSYITSGAVNSKQATQSALSTIGASVFMGGFSTFLGMLVTGFSSSEIFRIFFKMFFGIVTLGLIHGLIILPAFLTIFRIQTVAASENNENQETGNHVNKVNAEDAPA